MLREVEHVHQVRGEPIRRWFASQELDLIVWYSPAKEITGFQLCYDKGKGEKALTWTREAGFSHRTVDDGESRGGQHKMTPVLLPDGALDKDRVLSVFKRESRRIDPEAVEFVAQSLARYPGDDPRNA